MGLLQQYNALRAAGVSDAQFRRASDALARGKTGGLEPNSIRRGGHGTRLADKMPLPFTVPKGKKKEAQPADDDSSSTTSDETPEGIDEDSAYAESEIAESSTSSSDSSDDSSSSSTETYAPNPEERAGGKLMSHTQLRRIAASVRGNSEAHWLASRAVRPLSRDDMDAAFESYGTVREVKAHPGERFGAMTSGEFAAAHCGLDTEAELHAARDFAKRRAQAAPEHTLTSRMKDEHAAEAQKIVDGVLGDMVLNGQRIIAPPRRAGGAR
jgi:hypothetical protein